MSAVHHAAQFWGTCTLTIKVKIICHSSYPSRRFLNLWLACSRKIKRSHRRKKEKLRCGGDKDGPISGFILVENKKTTTLKAQYGICSISSPVRIVGKSVTLSIFLFFSPWALSQNGSKASWQDNKDSNVFPSTREMKHYLDLLPRLVSNIGFPLCDVILQQKRGVFACTMQYFLL